MKKIGSHDSMTYLKPKSIWLRPFHFIAKTLVYDYKSLYEKGARMFDIRLKYNNKLDIWEFAHGLMVFEFGNIEEVFDFLNQLKDAVYVRMLLEYNKAPKNIDEITKRYIEYCTMLRGKYSNLIFFEYRRKYDWQQVYKYEGMPNPEIYLAVSSMTLSVYDDFFPWLYARTHNKDIMQLGTDKEWLLMDFIGCYC